MAPPAGVGLATTLQAVPFQCRIRGFPDRPPTAHALLADVAATAERDPPVENADDPAASGRPAGDASPVTAAVAADTRMEVAVRYK
jgi:hypothetical protein